MSTKAQWEAKALKDIALINPEDMIIAGPTAKQVNMDKLKPHNKVINGFEWVEFSGKGSKFRNKDILVPKISSALEGGKAALVNILDEGEIGIGSNWFIVLRAIENVSDPDFLYYLVKTPWFMELAIKTLEGSSQSRYLNVNTLTAYEFFIPEYEEQCRISSVLKVIDNKIEKNTKVCDEIEKILEQVFCNWFSQYDRRKSDLPEGWRNGVLSEIGDIVAGSTPSKKTADYYTKYGISWITPKDLSKQGVKFIAKGAVDITDEGLRNCSTRILPRGTILFSSRAPIGYMGIATNELVTNQGFRSIVPFSGIGSTFVYYLLRNKINEITNIASGSTFKEISGQALKKLEIVIPEASVLADFDTHTKYLMRYQENMEHENHLLSRLRNHLLPLLMSGELQVGKRSNDV